MAAAGVIEPSDSPWAAPAVFVRKKDDGWRFCVDYRRLNAMTKNDSYPLPRINDALDFISGSAGCREPGPCSFGSAVEADLRHPLPGAGLRTRLKEDGNQILESFQAEQSKGQQLQEKIRMLEQDRVILQSEKIHLEQQAKIMQQNLDSKDLCQDSDSTVQQSPTANVGKVMIEVNAHPEEIKRPVFVPSLIKRKAAQIVSERRDKELKTKEALKSHKQNVKTIEEQHQKAELSYKAEIKSLQKKLQENKTRAWSSEQALAEEKKMTANLQNHRISSISQHQTPHRLTVLEPSGGGGHPPCSKTPPQLLNFHVLIFCEM
ncbi:hypothetical protein AAFF_G00372120 [Aldrovandia affinis]|uniref:Uncharacterized protein n=1 Tax=Aldrovandia affinis TaxID=143900 RepID=A0AAD7R4J1_9TELE|nr:hypothetical protein AAFF_G00372120 [Aldrovandia affinis]